MTKTFGNGITEKDIADAVGHSGYPLQTEVSNSLKDKFYVQEEWTYLDSDTGSSRSMDILAKKKLWDLKGEEPFVRPNLSLLIECKKSETPYVFFISDGSIVTFDFPAIAGLRSNTVAIKTDDAPHTWNEHVFSVLGLTNHKFLTDTPYHCMTFSKCVRNGKKIVLSGDEPYNSIILPLIKSVDHYQKIERPVDTARYYDLDLVVPVAVVNAPLIGAKKNTVGEDEIIELDWVRVYRHTYNESKDKFSNQKVVACDIVSSEFLSEYIDKHVMPFAEELSAYAKKHHEVLAKGKAFVSGLNKEYPANFEPHIQKKKGLF